MKKKLSRSIPYFNVLLKTTNNKRMSVLQAFPDFVVDDLIEILFNVVLGNIDIGKRARYLQKHKNALIDVVNIKSKIGRRRHIYRQKGSFLASLIPIVLTLLGNL